MGSRRQELGAWMLRSEGEADEADEGTWLEARVLRVLGRLEPAWREFVELGIRFDAEMSCAVYSYEAQTPAIHLGKEIIGRLSELYAEIDIDVYCLRTEDDPQRGLSSS